MWGVWVFEGEGGGERVGRTHHPKMKKTKKPLACSRSRSVARMVGPGNWPLTRMTSRSTPSGAARPQAATRRTLRVRGAPRSAHAAAHAGEPGDAASAHAAVWQK